MQGKSDEDKKSVDTNKEEIGSNDQFDQYTSEIYDGLKFYASHESIESGDEEKSSQMKINQNNQTTSNPNMHYL